MPADEPLPPGTPQPNAEPDRSAQPVDDEQPPHLPFPVVGVGASAGGLEAFGEFLGAMRADSGMAFVFILHLPPDVKSHLAEVLARRTAMPVRQVEDGMPVEPNRVYVIRPGHVLTVLDGRLRLGPELGGPRAANRPIDDFFRSLAAEQRERAVCVVLSGMGSNGTAGAQAIKAVGGLCVAQDPESAAFASMPRHLIDAGYADYIARPADLPDVLLTYAGSPYATGGREADAAAVLEREQQHLREVLAILRTRTKQDFTGYKKPTVLRRVQRRMGLARVPRLAEYAKLLRQSPTEVIALADDLLIHVTGFFRDPEAWAVLYERVVVPLVEAREPGAPVRAWVTACSSGEEAYSLAMLLTEESERTGKRLDIKVFATDLAERALSHARAGSYPGGIESEIAPDRLARFFVRQDEMYWIRQDLRDRVVFAPQNVLQDPPFSRLDIASCRNLLIYLEPEVQKRVLTLLHFGLREGGALFLGSSETLSGAEELFETVDKKARIFRRVGPTRHGVLDFPLPRALPLPARPAAAGEPRPEAPRAPVAELTRRVLLDAHTPPAVTVDRDFHIVYYHGDTRPFLEQLSGEPTRDLLLLARDGVRAAVRVALHRAAADGRRVSGPEGWVDAPDRRVRVRVTVSPFPPGGAPPDFYVVSFEDRGDIAPPPAPGGAADGQVQRLQDELRGAVEELQTSNEELKAANEEVMSINEELQSANEELETSKEEMQSLNEELRTVNAQLRAKMEEHQGAASDLASLLTSTDIAVLFLDPQLRIRRYTPAVRDLVDLIATDVGRPLDAMARRFADPHLDDDCAAVLARLLPAEREVPGADGRHYLRRATAYRTVDNRIDGVVVTFVDVTARTAAERALRESEERQSFLLALSDALRPLADPGEIQDAACRLLGERLGADRAYFVELDEPAGAAHVRREYRRGDSPPLAGRYRIADFGWVIPAMRRGGVLAVPDVTASPLVPPADRPALAAVRIGAHVNAPLIKGGALVGALCVTEPAPRAWAPAEAELVREVGERIWAAVERARAEAALAAELDAMTRLHALSDRLLTAPDLSAALGAVLDTALALHGAEMGTAQVYDPAADGLRYAAYRGFDAAALAALPVIDRNFHSTCAEAVRTGRRVVVADFAAAPEYAEHIPAAAALGYRAAISTPLTTRAGEFRGVLTVHFRGPHAPSVRELRLADLYAPPAAHVIERAQAAEALRAGEARLAAVAAQLPSAAVFVVDRDLRYLLADGEALREVGFAAADFVGRTVREAVGAAAGEHEGHYRAALGGAPFRHEHTAHGRLYITHGVPLRDAAGAVEAVLAVSYDITARKRAEESLRESEGRLRLAVAAGALGTWDWDIRTGRVVWNDEHFRMQGYAAGEVPPSYDAWLARVHPDDRAGAEAALVAARAARAPYAHNFRSLHPGGAVHWLEARGSFFYDEAGDAVRMIGVARDVTDQREAERALRASEERLRLALSAARMGTWAWDAGADAHHRDANLNALLGLPAAETAQPLEDLLARVHPEDRAAVRAAFDQSVRQGRPLNVEFRVVRPHGAVRWLRAQGDVFGTAGSVRMAGACVDVTDLKEAEAALQRANDELEGRVRERTNELAAALDSLETEMARRADLARRLSTAQEDERKRVARDLHDSVGQLLAGLAMAFKSVEAAAALPAPVAAKLTEAQRVADALGKEVHALAVRLRPTSLDDLGLEAALGQLVREWSDRTGVRADFHASGIGAHRLPADVETAVYRAVQEALTNVARHARATSVGVVVRRPDGFVSVAVEDNGVGFDPAAATDRLGLVGMRERISLVGGELEIESRPEAGTSVLITIPVATGGDT